MALTIEQLETLVTDILIANIFFSWTHTCEFPLPVFQIRNQCLITPHFHKSEYYSQYIQWLAVADINLRNA